MRKSFGLAAILLLTIVAQIAAGPATYSATDAQYTYKIERAIDSDGAFDTLAAADSSTLISNWQPEQGGEYILVRDVFTGAGSDSVSVQLVVDAYTNSGALLYRTAVDSFTTSAGEQVLLPIGGSVFGDKFTIKLIGYGDDGGQLILNRLYIYKREVIQYTKSKIF